MPGSPLPSHPVPPAVPPPRRRWRKALKITLWTLTGLTALALAFHRPLLRLGAGYGAKKALAGMGLTFEGEISGSVTGDLTLDNVRITGDENAQIRSITLKHAEADYDLMELRGGGAGRVLKSLTARDLDVTIDLTLPGKPKKPKSGQKPKRPPPDVRVPRLRLEHATARITLKNGREIMVEDLTLVIDPAAPGVIEVARLRLPGVPPLENARGTTRATADTVAFENVRLWEGVTLEELAADVSRLSKEEAPVRLAVTQDGARVKLAAVASAWSTNISADGTLEVENLSDASLRRWNVPMGPVNWTARKGTLRAKGPVLRPDSLEADLTLNAADVVAPGFTAEEAALRATLAGGRLTARSLDVLTSGNTATLSGSAKMPEKWKDIARSEGAATIEAEAPNPGALLPSDAPPLSGRMRLRGEISFAAKQLTAARASATGEALRFQGIPFESAKLEAALQGREVTVEEATVNLNASNGLTVSGGMNLDGDRPWRVRWRVEGSNPASLSPETRPKNLPWPEAGFVRSQGSAEGTLEALRRKDWTTLTGEAWAEAAELRLDGAALERLTLRAAAEDGRVSLSGLTLRLDERNHAEARGSLNLAEEAMPFNATLTLELPELVKLTPWVARFGGPEIQAGSARVAWEGGGNLKPLEPAGAGSLRVENLRIAGAPETLSISATARQEGGGVTVPDLKAAAGPWRTEGALTWTPGRLEVKDLRAWLKTERLAALDASLPLGGAEKGPLRPDDPLSLKLRADRLDTRRLAEALGQTWPATATVSVSADLGGTLDALTGRVAVDAADIRTNAPNGPKLDPAAARLTAELKNGRLAVDGSATQRPLRPLTLTAEAPLPVAELLNDPKTLERLPLRVSARLPESSLAFVPGLVPAVRSARGTVAADLELRGTPGDLTWRGQARLNAPELSLTGDSLPSIRDLNVRLRADQRQLTIERAEAMVAGGVLRARGRVDIGDLQNPAFDARIVAEELLVLRNDQVSLRANADVTVRGPLDGADVRGRVGAVRGRVFKEIEYLPLSLPNQLPPPPPPATAASGSSAPALPPPLDRWNFDIRVVTEDPVRLLGNVARGAAVADLRLTGSGANPSLLGRVQLRETRVKLPFSRLDVTKGDILFTAERPFDPQIDLTAESNTADRQITVTLQGRALDPKVRLTSSPPLPEGDIAALLATGATTSDLTGSGEAAAGRAAFVVLSEAYRKLFRKEKALYDEDFEDPLDGRLSFQFSLFGSDSSRRGVSAVYEFNDKWRAIGRVGETGTFRGLLYYLIRLR